MKRFFSLTTLIVLITTGLNDSHAQWIIGPISPCNHSQTSYTVDMSSLPSNKNYSLKWSLQLNKGTIIKDNIDPCEVMWNTSGADTLS